MTSIKEIDPDIQDLSRETSDNINHAPPSYDGDEKKGFDVAEDEIYVPGDSEEVIDPRLKDYPIPLVAKTVDLHNDPT